MTQCANLGARKGMIKCDGQLHVIHDCLAGLGECFPAGTHPTGLACSEACPRFRVPTPAEKKAAAARTRPARQRRATAAELECQFRGRKVREDISNTCGSVGEQIAIYSCELHGECSIGRYCALQKVRTCISCDDRKEPEPPLVTISVKPFPQERGPNPFMYHSHKTPVWISLAQLTDDVKLLAGMIPPDTSRIVGVSRSGVLPASMLALLLHLPWSIVRQSKGDIIDGGNGWRLTGRVGGNGPVVVIDDTCMTGNSFKHVMPIVRKEFPQAIAAAVYVNPRARVKPELYARELPHPHLLEWNVMNSILTPSCAFDFDGILCHDCPAGSDDDGPKYLEFLRTATPRYPVRKVKIPLIVTARLEKYRGETEAWLAAHGMSVDKMIMGPWGSLLERSRVDIGEWKGQHFATFLENKKGIKPKLFIESDARQAKRIAEVSGGFCVCPDAGRVFP